MHAVVYAVEEYNMHRLLRRVCIFCRSSTTTSSAAMCRSRGPPPASSSPLGAYSSPAARRITPHNLTSPLYLRLSTYILVEYPPRSCAQRLVRVSRHHMTREQHASLSPAPQLTHAVAPVTGEYVPAQHQHA